MPDVNIRAGGAPVPSTILVNVDNETVFGDGSIKNPLRTAGQGATEQVVATSATVELDPTARINELSYGGIEPEGPLSVTASLSNGLTDGFQVVVNAVPHDNVTFLITPDSFINGLNVEITGAGSAIFMWSAAQATWFLIGSTNVTINT